MSLKDKTSVKFFRVLIFCCEGAVILQQMFYGIECLQGYQRWKNTHFIAQSTDIIHCVRFCNPQVVSAANSNPALRFSIVTFTALHISRDIYFANKMTIMFDFLRHIAICHI
jgi:hypothetical protein